MESISLNNHRERKKDLHQQHSTKEKTVRFFGIDPKEEEIRSDRGAVERRQRKEEKALSDQNRQGRIRATLQIIRTGGWVPALLSLCNNGRDNDVALFLTSFLNGFVDPNQNMRARLAAFRQVPANRFNNLSPRAENQLMSLNGEPSFAHTFRAYLPSAVLTSGSDNDSPPTRRRSTRRTRWRQIEENHRAMNNNSNN